MIVFQGSSVIHGAVPVFETTSAACPTTCRRSVEFRVFTYKNDPSCDQPYKDVRDENEDFQRF